MQNNSFQTYIEIVNKNLKKIVKKSTINNKLEV